jgi:hypothetical protein
MELAAFLETPELAALGPGPRPGCKSIPDLEKELTAIFRTGKLSTQSQALIRATIFLWHDHLDKAHSLAQDVSTIDGSLIHAIMHRREPDYGNAKYWFHRVGTHPAYKTIGQLVAKIPTSPAERILHDLFNGNETWDPFAFVDCCQEEARTPSDQESFLRQIQKAEFSALLENLTA